MHFYRFKAYDSSNRIIQGYEEAENEAALINHFRKNRLTPRFIKKCGVFETIFILTKKLIFNTCGKIDIENKKQSKDSKTESLNRIETYDDISNRIQRWKKDYIGKRKMASFTRELSMLLNSGIPIDKSLRIISNSEVENRYMKDLINAIQIDILKGTNIVQACSKYPVVFSPEYLGLLKVGMETGRIIEVMETLANYLEREDALYRRLKSALIYPAFILTVAMLTNIAIFVFVIPQISKILQEMKIDFPLCTRLMFFILNSASNPYIVLIFLLAIIAVFYQMKMYLGTPVGKYNFEMIKFMLPLTGPITQKLFSERFCRAMGVFFKYRVDILNSIKIIREMFKNPYLDEFIFDKLEKDVNEGIGMDVSFKNIPQIPKLVTNLASIGFHTGEISLCFDKAAEIYDLEIQQMLQKMLVMIEPLLVGLLGLFILFIILSIFLPLYQAIGSLGS